MGRYLDLARAVLPVVIASDLGRPVATVTPLACDMAALDAENGPMPDLSRILPRPHELTPRQRRLWRERTTAYRADVMTRTEAEQEAMAELICTGKLCDPGKSIPWPGCTSPNPDVQRPYRNIGFPI